jgi:predicted O-methyltransferase YrrM
MREGATAVSVERDADRAGAAAGLFSALAPQVAVRHADWTAIAEDGPFDLLVLDGGGQGKADGPAADPAALLRPGGVLVIDDFTPARGGPPTHEGAPDAARLHWLEHPALRTVEIPLAPDLAVLLATRVSRRSS